MRRLVLAVGLLVALVLIAAGVWWQVRPQAAPWPIVVQRTDGNIVLMDDAGKEQALTTEGDGRSLLYLYPTPAPDGRSIAVVALRPGAEMPAASLQVLGVDGKRNVLFEQPGQLPFYLSWAPNGSRIAFLVGSTGAMALHAAAVGDEPSATRIAEGQPNYFAWAPDGERLMLHYGGEAPAGRLGLYEWGAAEPQLFEAQPALFNTPVWLPDGKSAFVMLRQDDSTALATIDPQGNVLQRLADVEPGTRFVLAPDSRQLAYFQPGLDPLGELHLVAADGADNRTVERSVIGAIWSPRGDTLAFLTLAEDLVAGQAPLLRWNAVSLADGTARPLVEFRPTAQFVELLPYFDQYAQSHRLWDREGNRLLYATDEGVFALDVRSGGTQRIGDGVLGLWME